jgi:arylsulfatase A-like enzyme
MAASSAVKILGSFGLLVTLAVPELALAVGPRNVNLLLVIADDIGVDKVGSYAADVDESYGSTAEYLPETPVLDLLAESGVRFTEAWANPACSPTRASLYTGRLAMRHGVGQAIGKDGTAELSLNENTLAMVLSREGYATGLFGKWHLGEGEMPEAWEAGESYEDHLGETISALLPPSVLGWDWFQGTKADLDVGGWDGYYNWMELVASPMWGGWVHPLALPDYATISTTDAALAWIEDQTSPWFATVAYHAPHLPLEMPPEGCGYNNTGEWPEEEAAIYAAMVECMDEQIGVLLDNIRGLENTVVIFVGDNGTESDLAEGVFADGRGKGTVYESGVHVPLIVADGYDYLYTLGVSGLNTEAAWRSRVAYPGRTIPDAVHVLDLFATLGDLGGGDIRTGVDATSLVPLLTASENFERRPVVSKIFNSHGGTVALRKGDYKLIATVRRGHSGCLMKYEVYNLSTDRLEQTDLARRSPQLVEVLVHSLAEVGATEPGGWLDVQDCDES